MHPIIGEVEKLSPQAQQEVIELVAALLKQQRYNPNHRLKQNWGSAMQAYRDA